MIAFFCGWTQREISKGAGAHWSLCAIHRHLASDAEAVAVDTNAYPA